MCDVVAETVPSRAFQYQTVCWEITVGDPKDTCYNPWYSTLKELIWRNTLSCEAANYLYSVQRYGPCLVIYYRRNPWISSFGSNGFTTGNRDSLCWLTWNKIISTLGMQTRLPRSVRRTGPLLRWSHDKSRGWTPCDDLGSWGWSTLNTMSLISVDVEYMKWPNSCRTWGV